LVTSSDNSTNSSSNTSLNSLAHKCWSVEARVFHVIDDSEIELTSMEIARKIHAPRKPTRGQCITVRGVLRKLLEKGMVLQPYPGSYCNKITYGLRFVPLCVHNISLRSFVKAGDERVRFYISSRCINAISELLEYNIEVKERDHTADGIRYGIPLKSTAPLGAFRFG
jgi:hypothetical protein